MPKDSIVALFRLVKKGMLFLKEDKGIEKERIGLDPTGGTKVMSVGSGLATSILDVDILYVNNDKYNEVLRRPEPGSEQLINFESPKYILVNDKLIEDVEISRKRMAQVSEYFKDVTTTHIIYLALKSGDLLSKIDYLDNHKLKEDLFSGYISVLNDHGKEYSEGLGIQSARSNKKPTHFSVDYERFKVNVFNGKFARLIFITDSSIKEEMNSHD